MVAVSITSWVVVPWCTHFACSSPSRPRISSRRGFIGVPSLQVAASNRFGVGHRAATCIGHRLGVPLRDEAGVSQGESEG